MAFSKEFIERRQKQMEKLWFSLGNSEFRRYLANESNHL
jgi:hypothetical protein